MLITSHLAATLFLGKALSLGGVELGIALLGGVGIDADHFFTNAKWRADIQNFIKEGRVTHGEVKQHSWLQEMLFGLVTGIIFGVLVSLFLDVRWWIFPLFQAGHIFMDGFMRYEHQPFIPLVRWKYRGFIPSATMREWIVSFAVLAVLVLV